MLTYAYVSEPCPFLQLQSTAFYVGAALVIIYPVGFLFVFAFLLW